jgi:hypothetical protein
VRLRLRWKESIAIKSIKAQARSKTFTVDPEYVILALNRTQHLAHGTSPVFELSNWRLDPNVMMGEQRLSGGVSESRFQVPPLGLG